MRTIPTVVTSEVVRDLSNRHPHSSLSTISSVIEDILTEDSSQLSTKSFSAGYHSWDNLFLVDNHIPEETGPPDVDQGTK